MKHMTRQEAYSIVEQFLSENDVLDSQFDVMDMAEHFATSGLIEDEGPTCECCASRVSNDDLLHASQVLAAPIERHQRNVR